MSTATELITKFELQVSDITELSTSEELIVMNRIYQRVCADRPWEFLKTNATGTMSSDATGYYITVPSDFAYFYENANYTDSSIGYPMPSAPKVIFIGTDYSPYNIINYSDRMQYRNRVGYCYLSLGESKIRFCGTPVSTTYSMDYIKFPDTLTANSTPLIPTRFEDILIYGMATENDIIQVSDKAKSYAPENLDLYNAYLADMALWNSNLLSN